MAAGNRSVFYQELIDSDDFSEVAGGDHAEYTGAIGNTFIKVLSEEDAFFTKWIAKTDPAEPGFSIDERRERMEQFSADQDDYMYNTPEIIFSEGDIVEMELLEDAMNLTDFAHEEPYEDVIDVSRKLGETVRDMHEGNWAFRDLTLGNIMVDERFDGEYELYLVDSGLAKRDPNKGDKIMGLTAFSYAYGGLPPEVSGPLMEGFSEGYGLESSTARLVGALGALVHTGFDGDLKGAYRTLDATL